MTTSSRLVRVPVIAGVLVSLSVGVARADNPIAEGMRMLFRSFAPAGQAGANVEIAPEQLVQFLGPLKKLLTAEIHFFRKICHPNAEQLAAVRQTGEQEIESIAREYALLQRKNQHSGFPDARDLLMRAMEKGVAQIMPAEVAELYSEELAARREAHAHAATAMMTVVIDRAYLLSPEQFDKVHSAIAEQPDPQWLRNLQIYLYDEYAPMPGPNLLRPLLSDRQREILKSRTDRGMIHFGWESDLGLQMWGGGMELKELDEYPREETP